MSALTNKWAEEWEDTKARFKRRMEEYSEDALEAFLKEPLIPWQRRIIQGKLNDFRVPIYPNADGVLALPLSGSRVYCENCREKVAEDLKAFVESLLATETP